MTDAAHHFARQLTEHLGRQPQVSPAVQERLALARARALEAHRAAVAPTLPAQSVPRT